MKMNLGSLWAISMLTVSAATASEIETAQFKGDAARTGYLPVRAVQKPRLAWRVPVAGWVGAAPVVDAQAVYVLTNLNHLYALKRSDGKTLWEKKLRDALPDLRNDGNFEGKRLNPATPALHGNTLIVVSNNGWVSALEKDSGKVAWEFDTGKQIYAAPLVHDGKVFVKPYDNTAIALDARTGEVTWKSSLSTRKPAIPSGDGATSAGHSGFAFADGTLFAGVTTEIEARLLAVDAKDQRVLFSKSIFQCCEATPAIAEGMLFTTDRENVVAFDAKTGEEKWKTPVAFRVRRSAPAVHNGKLYIGGKGIPDGRGCALKCLDIRTGKELWRHAAGAYIHSTPLIVNGAVYNCSTWTGDCRIYAVDPESGKELWSWKAETPMRRMEGGPAAADGAVYFGTGWEDKAEAEEPWRGYVYALEDAATP